MHIINWNENYSVKIAKIDSQHKELIDIINRLFDAMKSGKAREVISQIMIQLQEYTVYHFSTEEYLLQEHCYPLVAQHLKEHDRFVDDLGKLRDKLDAGRLGIGLELMGFLSHWLTGHIRGSDNHYSAFLREKGVS